MFQVTASVNPSEGEAMKAENPTVNIYNPNALRCKIYLFMNIYFAWKFSLNPEDIPTVDDVRGCRKGETENSWTNI